MSRVVMYAGIEMEALVARDPRAWELFVDRHLPSIRCVVAGTLRPGIGSTACSEDVDDVVQDVFTRLCRNDFRLLRAFDDRRAALSTWLGAIARNTSIDFLRRRKAEMVPIDVGDDLVSIRQCAPVSAGVELPARLLSGRQLLAMHLIYDRGLTVKEAAEIMGVRPQTVRSVRHKAIVKMRRLHFSRRQKREPN